MENAEFWNESQSFWEETSLSCWTLSSTSDPSCHSSTTWCSQSVSQFSPGSLSPSISLPSAISRNSYLLLVKIKWALNKSERGKLMFFRRRSSYSLFVMLQYVCLFSKSQIDFPQNEISIWGAFSHDVNSILLSGIPNQNSVLVINIFIFYSCKYFKKYNIIL